jgi:hypothetical protein
VGKILIPATLLSLPFFSTLQSFPLDGKDFNPRLELFKVEEQNALRRIRTHDKEGKRWAPGTALSMFPKAYMLYLGHIYLFLYEKLKIVASDTLCIFLGGY